VSALPEENSANRQPEWMRRAERGNRFWLAVMRWMSLTFGRSVSRVLLPFIALYFTLAAPAVRRSSRDYLGRCLQRRPTLLDVHRHILAFSATIHDRVYILNDRRDLFDVRLSGLERLVADVAARGGVLLFGAHLGSFEMLRAAARDQPGLHVIMAMYPDNARQVNRTLAAVNPSALQDIIELGHIDSMLRVHQRLQEGAVIGVLADRAAAPSQFVRVPFLGSPAPFPSGPFRMAAILRRPVYFMAGLYRGGNRYDLHFEWLTDFSRPAGHRGSSEQELLDGYVAALERHCRSAPHNWFNFYDFWNSAKAVAASAETARRDGD
jgi:predicted LPLAT superfamily acyltransferase